MTRVKIEGESAHRLFLWPVSGGAVKGSVVHRCSSSIQEIALRQGQHFRGFTGEQTAVGTYFVRLDRKSTRLNSSHQIISYAVFCLKKKNHLNLNTTTT